MKNLKINVNVISQKINGTEYEINIVRDMANYIGKYFNKEENFWTNQQVIGMREVLRGIMVKDCVAMPVETMHFTSCNKVLIKKL